MTEKGFTLIELVVVFTVVAIIFSMGVAGYSSYNSAQTITTAQADIVSMLQKAKFSASSQVKPSGCIGTLTGYEVDICDAPSTCTPVNSYYLKAICGNTPTVQSGKLPQGVSFTLPLTTQFIFPLLTGGVQQVGAKTITIINSSGVTKTITVSPDGKIDAR